ncbi:DUF1275 domain protein [Metarhizium acridum CQMa 102]|uniref:DUF1275 domain protein n=1 Tax=Metarhizium acridum (strain CQMa 102) TaxID=655827 RepID=E9E7Q3_METAQ|nr:DUF1275 domain protein [Metarhizium acridum CQMa 102]EFY88037.1 DUF1275 domain protein [Metarhizium acridum CQMa 102]
MENPGRSDSDTDRQSKEEKQVVRKLSQNVDLKLAYLPMLACCFVSGLTDGTIYNGNTIFVALGTSGYNNKPYGWARSLCSIAFFIVGSFAFSRFALYLGGRRRGIMMLSFLIQAILVIAAASIVQGGVVDGSYPSRRLPTDVDFKELLIIALLSFQAAGQIVSSRTLKVGEVPTVVVTSMLCDLMSDPALFTLAKNDKRNRRFIAFVLTLVGAICGGWISKAAGAVDPSLWTVAGIKLVIACSWLFWKAEPDSVV